MRQFLFAVGAVLAVNGDLIPTYVPPMMTGCPNGSTPCEALKTYQLNTAADLAGLVATARSCANEATACSINLEVEFKVTGENTCGDSVIGFTLGKDFPAGWTVEPLVTLSAPLPDSCTPTGGRYSDKRDETLCTDELAGEALPVTPTYNGDTTLTFNHVGQSLVVYGCTPPADLSYTVTALGNYHYGQPADDDESNAGEADEGSGSSEGEGGAGDHPTAGVSTEAGNSEGSGGVPPGGKGINRRVATFSACAAAVALGVTAF